MSIVKMSKLRLVGYKSDKGKILDELYLSSCAHIKPVSKINGTYLEEIDQSVLELEKNFDMTTTAISALEKLSNENVTEKIECDFSDFLKKEKQFDKMLQIVLEINNYLDEISKNYNLILKYKSEQLDIIPNEIKKIAKQSKNTANLTKKIDESTKQVLDRIYKQLLGVTSEDVLAESSKYDFQTDEKGNLFLTFKLLKQDYENLVNELGEFDNLILKADEKDGFVEIYFSFVRSMPEFFAEYEKKIFDLNQKIADCENRNVELYEKLEQFVGFLESLKIFSDFLTYKLEKIKAEQFMANTKSTFVLECYVAKKEVPDFTQKMQSKFDTLVISEEKITPSDLPPTKIKTGKVTKQADFVVNMYSVPNYNDVDPTWSVFLFFMIFFGFIIADAGYGLVLLICGYAIAHHIKEENGAKRLWKLIGTGGAFAIVWGVLFGSYFGFSHLQWSVLPAGIMPDPQASPILLLLFCLLMGVLQLAFGYLLKGINYFKHGKICAGFVNGVAWVLFLIGAVMACAKFLLDFFGIGMQSGVESFVSAIATPGLVVMLVGLVVGVLFAGIGTKGFTKFSKSFSALYGIINLFSDILSYARLFGLMLSSAIIAQQFNQIGLGLMTSPAGYIFGFIVILIGHAFNISMGALSAYIHDVRLQYVEYFGKFYTGEGTLFTPFGAKLKYVKFKN